MINAMVIGLPGNMATHVAKRIIKEQTIQLLPYSITGNDVDDKTLRLNDFEIELVKENDNERKSTIINENKPFIAIDYTEL